MPCRAMQKVNARKGCMLRCAWLPPTFEMVLGLIAVKLDAGPQGWSPVELDSTSEVEGVLVGLAAEPFAFHTWVCVGISAIESVCACSPPRSPSVWPLPT